LSRWAGLLAVNLAAVILGSAALFGRIDASPAWIVAGRTAFASVVIGGLILVRRQPVRLTGRRLGPILVTAALLAAHWIAFFASVQMAGVAVAAVTVATFPLFSILIEAALARRRPHAVEMLSGAAIVAAVALIVGPGAPATPQALPGAVLGLGAAALFAVFALASQTLMKGMGQLPLSLVQYVLATLILLPVLPFVRPIHGAADWLAVAALGVVLTAGGHQLYLFGLSRLPASVCGALVSLEPVYAIVFAAVLFHEPLRPAAAASGAIIVGATWLLLRDADAREKLLPLMGEGDLP
jgi:drug/metabolite transporter (DMT)-like permease